MVWSYSSAYPQKASISYQRCLLIAHLRNSSFFVNRKIRTRRVIAFARKDEQDDSTETSTMSVNKTETKGDGIQLATSEGPKYQYTQEGWEQVLKRFWTIAQPYWTSDQKGDAIRSGLLVLGFTLGTTGVSVGFNFLGRDFYNSLASKDIPTFTRYVWIYLAAFTAGVPVFVLRDYFTSRLSLKWRTWMTQDLINKYFDDRSYYRIHYGIGRTQVDNPDQRLGDDVAAFTGTTLNFSLSVFNSLVDLVSFSGILYSIYPPLFGLLLAYSVGGTLISTRLGKSLAGLNFSQEKFEADFRYSLVRVRENSESIAFYSGEPVENGILVKRFFALVDNYSKLLLAERNLQFFTSGYRYVIQVLPAAVVAPLYFSGKVEFGVINQSFSAFNHILNDVSLVVFQFSSLASFSAVLNRLGEFTDVLEKRSEADLSEASLSQEVQIRIHEESPENNKALKVDSLTLKTPNGANTIISELSLDVSRQERILVAGRSGSGKTSFLRALAGLWRSGSGTLTLLLSAEELKRCLKNGYHDPALSKEVFFIPQSPYLAIGSLRQQLLYPTWPDEVSDTNSQVDPFDTIEKPEDADILKVLEEVGLSKLLNLGDLNHTLDWNTILSLGERQRLSFARLFLSKPKPALVLLDECTSALDEATELKLYELMR